MQRSARLLQVGARWKDLEKFVAQEGRPNDVNRVLDAMVKPIVTFRDTFNPPIIRASDKGWAMWWPARQWMWDRWYGMILAQSRIWKWKCVADAPGPEELAKLRATHNDWHYIFPKFGAANWHGDGPAPEHPIRGMGIYLLSMFMVCYFLAQILGVIPGWLGTTAPQYVIEATEKKHAGH